MAHFKVPDIVDNEDGWGPSSSQNDIFSYIPYAPYSKGDRIGKAADWYGQPSRFNQNSRYQSYGASAPFAYRYEDDDDAFQVVDNTKAPRPQYPRRQFRQPWVNRGGRGGSFSQGGRGGQFQAQQTQGKGQKGRNGVQGQRAAPGDNKQGGYGNRPYGRFDNNRKPRTRESSVDVKSDWEVIEQIELSSFSKLATEVPEAEDLESYGVVDYYNKTYDRLNSKSEKPLERSEKAFFKLTTSDDPIIREFALQMGGTSAVFATDAVLATLMASPRSSYSWDIVIQRVGAKTFLDKRDNSSFDFLTVCETANEPPTDEKESINSPDKLSMEATFINQNYSQQVLQKGEAGKKHSFNKPNPFGAPEETASVGYRYRKWTIGEHVLVARTEVDAVLEDKGNDVFVLVKALNEFDPKVMDWRKKLDTQKGAVLATELKNNANKLAKWTAQAMLAGAEQINLGYVSRANFKDPFNHVILGSQFYKTKEFAAQINLTAKNMWAILKNLFDVFSKLPPGKFVLVKDPNKQVVRLYNVPQNAFDDLTDEGADDGEGAGNVEQTL